MQSELKPCPFCGRDNICPSSWDIQCQDCKAMMPGEPEDASSRWNRRAALSDQERAVEVKGLEIDELIEEMLDAQQDINLAANSHMDQSLCDASALIDRVEAFLLRIRSALVDVPVEPDQRLYDGTKPMADGGDTPMTAAEEVLAWLLIEKIGVPDDVPYSPDQAQEIIVRQLSAPPHREGEDSAEVERLRGLLAVALEALDTYSDPTSYLDSDGEPLPADAEIHEGVYAKETASSIRAALAATRSASATSSKGCAE